MEFYIKFIKFFDWISGYLFLSPPLSVSVDQLAELRPPVAQMVVFDNAVPGRFVNVGQGLADNSGAKMPTPIGLGDVWAGIINQRDLARIDSALAVFSLSLTVCGTANE